MQERRLAEKAHRNLCYVSKGSTLFPIEYKQITVWPFICLSNEPLAWLRILKPKLSHKTNFCESDFRLAGWKAHQKITLLELQSHLCPGLPSHDDNKWHRRVKHLFCSPFLSDSVRSWSLLIRESSFGRFWEFLYYITHTGRNVWAM